MVVACSRVPGTMWTRKEEGKERETFMRTALTGSYGTVENENMNDGMGVLIKVGDKETHGYLDLTAKMVVDNFSANVGGFALNAFPGVGVNGNISFDYFGNKKSDWATKFQSGLSCRFFDLGLEGNLKKNLLEHYAVAAAFKLPLDEKVKFLNPPCFGLYAKSPSQFTKKGGFVELFGRFFYSTNVFTGALQVKTDAISDASIWSKLLFKGSATLPLLGNAPYQLFFLVPSFVIRPKSYPDINLAFRYEQPNSVLADVKVGVPECDFSKCNLGFNLKRQINDTFAINISAELTSDNQHRLGVQGEVEF